MILNLSTPLRRLAYLLIANVMLAQAALAAPATESSLRKYFALADSPALAERAVDAIGAAKAKEWQDETDPAEKAKKKARFDRLNAIIKKHVTWTAIEPIMVENFQRHLQEEDVRALISYGQSDSGRVRFGKVAPAMINAAPQLMAYLDRRVDEIADREEGDSAPAHPAFQKPVDGSKAALAYTLLLEAPGAQDEFKKRMAAIESSMLSTLSMLSGEGNSEIRKQVTAMAARFQREVSYEEVAAFQSRFLIDSVSETELTQLIADQRKPELKRLLVKQKVAERDATDQANKMIGEKLFPKLMAEFGDDND